MTSTLHEEQCKFLIISRSFLLRIRKVLDYICRENQNTHFTANIVFVIMAFKRKCGRYCGAWQATDDNMGHVHCMPDK
jgi:hypothetical protein